MTTIQQLPQELLQHILSYLPKQDVLVSRMTNQAFAAASRPASFRHINLCYLSWSLRRLQALSCSGNAKYVRSLTVYTDSLSQDLRSFFEERLASPGAYVPNIDYHAAWIVCERYLADQELLSTLEWRTLLNSALSAFPNLEVIEIQDLGHGDRWSFFPRVTIWHPALDSFSALGELVNLPVCNVDHQTHLNVAAVLDAMGQRATKHGDIRALRELHIRCPITRSVLSGGCFEYYDGEQRSRRCADLIDAVSAIRVMTLDLSSSIATQAEPGQAISEHQAFSDMDFLLSHMVELEKLELKTYQKFRWEQDGIPKISPYNALLGKRPPSWPRLRHLELSADVSSKAMISFMQTHSETLVSLDISGCRFDQPEAVLSEIPKTLKLERIEATALGYLSSSGQDARSEVFILPRGVERENPDSDTQAIRNWLLTGEGSEPEWPIEEEQWY